MVDSHAKAAALEALASRLELSDLERAVVREAAARFVTDAPAEPTKAPVPVTERSETNTPSFIQPGATTQVDLVISTDGASRGNPGPAGIGVVLETTDGQPLGEIAEYIGHTTNNVAEYRALLAGLERALALGGKRLRVRADSELMIKQLRGDYQVKHARLAPLHREVRRLLGCFEHVELRHVRREFNARADELANAGIDSAR
jgi:ribonuclease HI